MGLITRSDDERLDREMIAFSSPETVVTHYDDAEWCALIIDSLRAALEKISELEETLYSEEDVADIKRAEDTAHKLYAKMKAERDAALSRIKQLEEAVELKRKECCAKDAIMEEVCEERDALKKTVEMAEILIKRYEAGGGPLK